MSASSESNKHRLLLPEFICILALGVTWTLFTFLQIPLRQFLSLYFDRLVSGTVLYACGIGLSLLVIRIRKKTEPRLETWKETIAIFKRSVFSFARITRGLRYVNSVALLFTIFLQLKHLTPMLRSRFFDSELYAMEQFVLKGRTFSELFIDLLGTSSAQFLSFGYTLFYPYLALCVLCGVLVYSERVQEEFFTSFSLLWLFGVLIVWICPTEGPCFFDPAIVEILPRSDVSELQNGMRELKEFVLANPTDSRGIYLISGFPSLHFAAVALGSLFLSRHHRLLGLASWLFLGLTFITTIYFGWHYLLDLLGSVALVWLSVRTTGLLMRMRHGH